VRFDDDYAFDRVDDTLVTVWRGDPIRVRLEHMVEQLVRIHERHPRGAFLYSVVLPTAGMPNAETRELMREQFQAMRNRLRAAAIVLEKRGVEGALSRTILSTLATLTRQPFALRTFAERGQGAAWLAGHSTLTPPSVMVARAMTLEQSFARGR